MKVYHATDVGLVRDHNEDDVRTGLLEDAAWAIVCDGMGGANAGEVASENAVTAIDRAIREHYSAEETEDYIRGLLHSSIYGANAFIFNLSEQNQQYSGMGTTVVAALATPEKVFISHVGDSRAYLLHQDSITQITKDHSMVQELVDCGTLTPEEARIHPQRNLITRCLGVRPTVEVDDNCCKLEKGDAVLLCSDGLTNYLTEEDLLEAFHSTDSEALVYALIEEAKRRGGSDNITVAMIENR